MPFGFKALRGDVLFRASFAKPEFGLLSILPAVYANSLNSMSSYGLQLQDMKVEQGSGNFSEFQLSMLLSGLAASIRLKLDGFEVQSFDFLKAPAKQVLGIAVDFEQGLSRSTAAPFQAQAFSLTLAYHGNLEGLSAKEFLSRFRAVAPDGLGPLMGSGAAFYYGSHGTRASSVLTMDLSALVQDGIFIRTQAVWDPSKVALANLEAESRQLAAETMASLGISDGLTL